MKNIENDIDNIIDKNIFCINDKKYIIIQNGCNEIKNKNWLCALIFTRYIFRCKQNYMNAYLTAQRNMYQKNIILKDEY